MDDYSAIAHALHLAGVEPTEEAILAALRPSRCPDADVVWVEVLLAVGRTFGDEGEDETTPGTVRPTRK